MQPTKWENIFANHTPNKGLIYPEVYKELLKLNQNNIQPDSKFAKGLEQTSLRRTYT